MKALLFPFIAVAAGILSLSSPCCLPLLPTYIGFFTGTGRVDGHGATSRRRTTRTAWSFVAGFTIVFTVFGALAGLLRHHPRATDPDDHPPVRGGRDRHGRRLVGSEVRLLTLLSRGGCFGMRPGASDEVVPWRQSVDRSRTHQESWLFAPIRGSRVEGAAG